MKKLIATTLLFSAFAFLSCKVRPETGTVSEAVPVVDDNICVGCEAATLEQASTLMEDSAKNFAKRGYSAFHSCQDAAYYFVRMATSRKLRAKRLDIQCGGTFLHAINLLLVKEGEKELWCPVEPQNSFTLKSAKNNLSEAACFPAGEKPKDGFEIHICNTYVELVSSSEAPIIGIDAKPLQPEALIHVKGLAVKGGASHIIFPEGHNPPGQLKPMIACAGAPGMSDLTTCKRCCEDAYKNVPTDVMLVNEWKTQCNWHCEDNKKNFKEPETTPEP